MLHLIGITLLVSLGDSLTTVYGIKKYGLKFESNPIWISFLQRYSLAMFVIMHFGVHLTLVAVAYLLIDIYAVYTLWFIACLPTLNNIYVLFLKKTRNDVQ